MLSNKDICLTYIKTIETMNMAIFKPSGIALGWKYSLLAAFIGILLAGSYSIYLLVSKKIDKKGHIAFGPYLSIGIFIALSYGSEIISWYLNLMM